MNVRSPAAFFLTSLLLLALAVPALAGATRSFVLDSEKVLAEGKLEGTAVTSDGSVVRSAAVKRIDLPGVPLARSVLVTAAGNTYVGTGNDGRIFAIDDGVARVFAETKQLMVTALAHDGKGTLFAATMPNGKIFAIDEKSGGKNSKEWTLPKGGENIWALAYDEKRATLFAGTGPEGKIFALDERGKADVYYDAEASHIMTLARDEDGTLYAGTSDQALLLRLRAPGRAEVVYDFDGNEITAIAVKQGELAVAANLFPKAPAAKATTPAAKPDAGSPQASAPVVPPPSAASTNKPQAGKGQLYRVSKAGAVEHLFTSGEGHLTSVEWGDHGAIFAGVGREGRIYRVLPDRSHAVWLDVDERQILGTQLTSKRPVFVTGDVGAIYEVVARSTQAPTWTSKVLDAKALARFGRLGFRGAGSLRFATRSGNTDKPDDSWSQWSAPMTKSGPIKSPGARFLQVQATLDGHDDVLYAVEAFYLPQNQPAIVAEVSIEPPRAKGDGKPTSSSTYKVKWKVDNDDGDALRHRVYAKQEQSKQWRALTRETDIVTASEYAWNTEAVPDGYYRVRVRTSDELDNPRGQEQTHERMSEPFLVDNHPPHIVGLGVRNGRVTGRAQDALGPITKLEYTVDGLQWQLLTTDDDLFDTNDEGFALPLSVLPKGNLGLSIRATDARGNTATAELEIDVK